MPLICARMLSTMVSQTRPMPGSSRHAKGEVQAFIQNAGKGMEEERGNREEGEATGRLTVATKGSQRLPKGQNRSPPSTASIVSTSMQSK